MGVVLRIGFGSNNDYIGIDPIGNVGLGAIEQPVIILLHGCGPHSRQITARIGLSHGDSQYMLAADTFWQQPFTLLLGTKASQIRPHQTAVQRVKPVTHAGIGGFLNNNLLKPKIGIAHTAILFIGPNH